MWASNAKLHGARVVDDNVVLRIGGGYKAAMSRPPRAGAVPAAGMARISGPSARPLMTTPNRVSSRVPAGTMGRGRYTKPESAVVALLAEIDLAQFTRPFLEAGFDEVDVLLDMSDADMIELGLRKGHTIKLRKRLAELAGDAAEEAPEMQESVRPAAVVRREPATAGPSPQNDLGDLGMVTGQHMTAVQMSWERVKLLGAEHFGGVWFVNFFKVDPDSQRWFPLEVRSRYQAWTADESDASSDLSKSSALKVLFSKKVNAVGYFIAGMSKTKGILPRVKQMGMRHLAYTGGMLAEGQMERLEEALIASLRTCLGESFTAEVEVAWSMVFQFMAAIMLCGYREAKSIEAKAKEAAAAALAKEAAEKEREVIVVMTPTTVSHVDIEETDDHSPHSASH